MTNEETTMSAISRYHRFRQDDGLGFGILRLDSIGSNRAIVVNAELTDGEANARLDAYRSEECGV